MEKLRVLAINTGSTSTKISVYDDEEKLFTQVIAHDGAELLEKFDSFADEYEYRKDLVLEELKKRGIDLNSISVVMAIGGLLPPGPSGAIEVNDDMCWQLRHRPRNRHASNLGAPVALAIARPLGIKAYIYDPVTVDELAPLAQISGLKEITRRGVTHTLNIRICAMKYAWERKRKFEDLNLIVVQLGGGITMALISGGRMIETASDEDGPFCSTRTGGLPLTETLEFFMQSGMTVQEAKNKVRGDGGLMSYLGVTDTREVERMIENGDDYARLIYEAMAYRVARSIGSLAPVVNCKIDAIILTGGIAFSDYFAGMVTKRVSAIAPVINMAGEYEMEALALGGLRVLKGEEQPKQFKREE